MNCINGVNNMDILLAFTFGIIGLVVGIVVTFIRDLNYINEINHINEETIRHIIANNKRQMERASNIINQYQIREMMRGSRVETTTRGEPSIDWLDVGMGSATADNLDFPNNRKENDDDGRF